MRVCWTSLRLSLYELLNGNDMEQPSTPLSYLSSPLLPSADKTERERGSPPSVNADGAGAAINKVSLLFMALFRAPLLGEQDDRGVFHCLQGTMQNALHTHARARAGSRETRRPYSPAVIICRGFLPSVVRKGFIKVQEAGWKWWDLTTVSTAQTVLMFMEVTQLVCNGNMFSK